MNKKRNVGILIFDNAEVLDFAGPFEVFSVTSELNGFQPFDVFTVGKRGPQGEVSEAFWRREAEKEQVFNPDIHRRGQNSQISGCQTISFTP